MLKRLLDHSALLSSNKLLVLCLVYYVLMAIITPGFFTINNSWNLLHSFLPLLILGLGQTFVMITAGIDLSITAIIAMASIIGGYVMSSDTTPFSGANLSIPFGLLAMLVTGAIIGLLNGLAVAILRMPAFMVTLTSMLFFSGLAVWLTQSQNLYNLPEAFINAPYTHILGIPIPAFLGVLILFIAYYLLNKSIFGEAVFAVGVNPETAYISGIRLTRTIILVYVISGCCAACASILLTARLETGSPVMGQNLLLDVIGAVVLGGTSLFGGKGAIQWTVAGALLMTMLDNSLNLLGLSFFLIMVFKGIIILVTAFINVLGEKTRSAMLRLEEIHKSFGSIAVLKGINLAVQAGEVLGLIGENGAGKSTLMNILGGVLPPTGGQMYFLDAPFQPKSPREAFDQGIAFIHQELNLFPNLSIGENLFIGNLPQSLGLWGSFISKRKIEEKARKILRQVGLDCSPQTLLGELTTAQKQLVEIAKALGSNPRLIIFDEPTTALSQHERNRLFQLIDGLKEAKIGVIYISHQLGEVLQISDRIAILRDGELVSKGPKQAYTKTQMVQNMVGRDLDQYYPARMSEPGQTICLDVQNLTGPNCKGISFTLREGEVLGFYGLVGAGRTEMARTIFGLDKSDAGTIKWYGQVVHKLNPRTWIERGLAMLTENRREEGLLLTKSILQNIRLASLPKYFRKWSGAVNYPAVNKASEEQARATRIKFNNLDQQEVRTLSGGNQQKVVLSKWLLTSPKVLILDEPTKGIDIGAKKEIYLLINELVASGGAIIIISSELEELLGMCDRILVMNSNALKEEFHKGNWDSSAILEAALPTPISTQA